MAINLEQIEKIYDELRVWVEQLSSLIRTYKRVEKLNLTPEQKQLLKSEFTTIKENIKTKLSELP